VPSLSRITEPVLMVFNAGKLTVPPARASNWTWDGQMVVTPVTVARLASVKVLPAPVASSVSMLPLPV
jgi:hypothetical protein